MITAHRAAEYQAKCGALERALRDFRFHTATTSKTNPYV